MHELSRMLAHIGNSCHIGLLSVDMSDMERLQQWCLLWQDWLGKIVNTCGFLCFTISCATFDCSANSTSLVALRNHCKPGTVINRVVRMLLAPAMFEIAT